MKIKWGSLVVDGRGKIGGHVASKNKSGNYLRTKTTPTNPNTSFQSAVRALFASISQAWSSLTEAQRSGWRNAVDQWQKTDVFGDLKKLTGKALFQRLNNQAQSAGFSAVTDAPEPSEIPEGVVTAVAYDTGAGTIALTGATTDPSVRIMVFATAPLSAGTRFVKNKLRLISTQPADSYDSSAVATAYVAKYGAPSAGDNVYFGVKSVIASGQASPQLDIKGTIT